MFMFKKWWMPRMAEDGGTGGGGASTEGTEGGTGGDGGAPQGDSLPPANEGGQITSPTPKTYTQEQVEGLIKTRIAEAKESVNKQYADHDRYKSLATRLAAMTGNTIESVEVELERLEAEAVSKQTGISPQVYQEIKDQQNRMSQIEKDNVRYKLDAEEAKMMINPMFKEALSKDEVRAEVREFAEKTGLTLEQSYWATQGAKGTQQMERDIEQRIMASLEKKAGRAGVITDTNTGTEDPNFGLTPDEVAFYQSQGDDLEEMAALKSSNSLDGFLKFKKSRAK